MELLQVLSAVQIQLGGQQDLFIQYLDHFIQYVKPSKDNPVLLILDNHETHISVACIDKAKESGVVMLTFPPHTSHKLQPLDRTVFGPFKMYYNVAVNEWMLSNPGKPLTIYIIAQVCGRAYLQAFTAKNIVSGFQVTGIHPLNENIFGDEEYLPCNVTDRPLERAESDSHPAVVPRPSTSVDSNQPGPLTSNDENPIPGPSRSIISPQIIKPFPKALPRKKKGGRKKGKSMIMTDTPEKLAIEEAKLKKKKNQSRTKKYR